MWRCGRFGKLVQRNGSRVLVQRRYPSRCRRRSIRRSELVMMLYFPSPADQCMVPGRLIRGDVGKRVEEGRCATASFQSLEYSQHIMSSDSRGCVPILSLLCIATSAGCRWLPKLSPRSDPRRGLQLEDRSHLENPASSGSQINLCDVIFLGLTLLQAQCDPWTQACPVAPAAVDRL